MNKIAIYTAIGLAVAGLYVRYEMIVRDNVEKQAAIEALAATVAHQSQEKQKIDQLNTEMVVTNAQLSKELEKIKGDLIGLAVTDQQRACNSTDLPGGYNSRLFHPDHQD